MAAVIRVLSITTVTRRQWQFKLQAAPLKAAPGAGHRRSRLPAPAVSGTLCRPGWGAWGHARGLGTPNGLSCKIAPAKSRAYDVHSLPEVFQFDPVEHQVGLVQEQQQEEVDSRHEHALFNLKRPLHEPAGRDLLRVR